MIYDVTVPISNSMPVWPGDPPVQLQRKSHQSRDKGRTVHLTAIAMGSHTGTHMDAPFHMIEAGKKLNDFSLDILVGRAKVLEIPRVRAIGRAELEKSNWAGSAGSVERVLFKTDNSDHWRDGQFYKEFVYLQPDGAEFLVERGVRLVGIDYLSIDKFESDSYPTHSVLLAKEILILEGLNLNGISPGEYMMYALPLNLEGGDGAPARVILMN